MVFVGKKKTRRKPAYPRSILDRDAVIESLEEANINIKSMHLDGFYQSLHRQHYPSLPKFVENYYKYEESNKGKVVVGGGGGSYSSSADSPSSSSTAEAEAEMTTTTATTTTPPEETTTTPPEETTTTASANNNYERPLKNKVTNRKNKNRSQLPKSFLEFLHKTPDFVTTTSRIQQKLTSRDKSTTKLIVELHDGQVVESVLMRYDKKGNGRASLCVSSQCGCAMGCTFCATGTMGLSGNLTTAEILEQLVHADAILAEEYQLREDKSKKLDLVRNIVFMGMGEPLDNYNNVVRACRAMMDRKRWNLAHGRVTVSTVGLVSQIKKLTRELPEVSLALSLHAPNQEMRTAIVPTATRYPIEKLIDALDDHMMAYMKKRRVRVLQENNNNNNNGGGGGGYTDEERIKESSRRRAMIEYVMLEGDTSSFECAHQLGKLCENRQLVVNLIPYNATDVKDKLQCPSHDHLKKFRDIVASYGTFCTIRRTMGADIASACGQLVQKKGDDEQQEDKGGEEGKETITTTTKDNVLDIEDAIGSPQNKRVINAALDEETTTKTLSSSSTKEDDNDGKSSWIESKIEALSSEDLERLTTILKVASSISASIFVVSALSMIIKNKR